MPYSYPYGKEEVVNMIVDRFPTESRILDVGVGVGTYADLLNPKGFTLEGLEIYEDYLDAYNVRGKYSVIHIGDIRTFNHTPYDLVIIGDVLEHLTTGEAQALLNSISNKCIVAIPYNCPQSGVNYEHNGYKLVNPHEEHKQSDLTREIMLSRYPMLKLYWENDLYAYFINFEI